MAQYKGIDVSKWQGVIDWKKVKNAGVEFAMLRIGFGSNGKDLKFEDNYKGAKAVGMPIGGYLYSYATSVEKAKAEARYCLSLIKGKQFEYPIVYDVEDKTQAGLGVKTISAMIKAFCTIMEEAGYYVAVYANKSWLDTRIDAECKKKYDIWLAQWTAKPTYTGSFGLWQYTDKGKVNGISGNVDMNISYKNYPNIMKTNGFNGFAKVKTEKPKEEKPKVEQPVKTETPVKVEKPAAKSYKAGTKVVLKNAKLYGTAYAKTTKNEANGTYYLYDGKNINGRYRITNSSEKVNKAPVEKNVTGFIKKADI